MLFIEVQVGWSWYPTATKQSFRTIQAVTGGGHMMTYVHHPHEEDELHAFCSSVSDSCVRQITD